MILKSPGKWYSAKMMLILFICLMVNIANGSTDNHERLINMNQHRARENNIVMGVPTGGNNQQIPTGTSNQMQELAESYTKLEESLTKLKEIQRENEEMKSKGIFIIGCLLSFLWKIFEIFFGLQDSIVAILWNYPWPSAWHAHNWTIALCVRDAIIFLVVMCKFGFSRAFAMTFIMWLKLATNIIAMTQIPYNGEAYDYGEASKYETWIPLAIVIPMNVILDYIWSKVFKKEFEALKRIN